MRKRKLAALKTRINKLLDKLEQNITKVRTLQAHQKKARQGLNPMMVLTAEGEQKYRQGLRELRRLERELARLNGRSRTMEEEITTLLESSERSAHVEGTAPATSAAD